MKFQKKILRHLSSGKALSFFIPLQYFLLQQFSVAAGSLPHNVVLFIADGLRPGAITKEDTPTFYRIMMEGVYFSNSHSMFPTLTMPNASAFATGHKIGDTGIYGNSIYLGFKTQINGLSPIPFLENNRVLSTANKYFSGDFLNQDTILKLSRQKGYSTAAIGKVGPILVFDHTTIEDLQTIIIDDMTGNKGGVPLSDKVKGRLIEAGLDIRAPTRGKNEKSGDHKEKGTLEANGMQQDYFSLVTTKVVLPFFKEEKKPFILVYWSRDPDGSGHNQGDSLNRLIPGINGSTSEEAIKIADKNLNDLILSLEQLNLKKTTNILVASDHGISTISKESATSYSATQNYEDVPFQFLPPGFVAIDLSRELHLTLFDPDDTFKEVYQGKHPLRGNAFLGEDKGNPKIVIAANGGSNLIYIPDNNRELAKRIVSFLSKQDYTSGLFVHDRYGDISGTLPFSSIDLIGSAVIPAPCIIINFRSFSTGCTNPLMCSVEVADTKFQQGQGMHGSFSQGDIKNFAAAIGPDFKKRFVDPAPINNADLGQTIASLLNITMRNTGSLKGRYLNEARPNGKIPRWSTKKLISNPDEHGHQTVLQVQQIEGYSYFDTGGYKGRTLGLKE